MELIRIGDRGDLLEQLATELESRGIRNAAVVSIVGAVRSATLTTMKAEDPKVTIASSYRNAEVAGVGEIVDAIPNLHVTLGLEDGAAYAGHLQSATVGGWSYVNIYVIPM